MERKIQLLIVDDEVRFLQTLTQRLTLRGFEVTAASNGVAALDAARSSRFDVALVDLKMPGMDGEQVLELLKQRDPFTEVIILTGHGSIDSAVRCTQAGSYQYLQKPCETPELLAVLKKAYQQATQKREAHEKAEIDRLMKVATAESPQAMLKRLRDQERKGGKR